MFCCSTFRSTIRNVCLQLRMFTMNILSAYVYNCGRNEKFKGAVSHVFQRALRKPPTFKIMRVRAPINFCRRDTVVNAFSTARTQCKIKIQLPAKNDCVFNASYDVNYKFNYSFGRTWPKSIIPCKRGNMYVFVTVARLHAKESRDAHE